MHAVERSLVVSGAGCLLGAAVWGWSVGPTVEAGVLSLGAVGAVLGLAGTALFRFGERRPDGLAVDPPRPLPEPAWWFPLLVVGAGALLVATAVAGTEEVVAGIVGAGLVGVAVVVGGLAARAARRSAPARTEAAPGDAGDAGLVGLDRATVRRARRVLAVTGGSPQARGYLVDLGRGGARLVVVSAGGRFDDVVLAGPTGAVRARQVAALAGLTVVAPDPRGLPAGLATGPGEWARMAGSV